MKNTTTEWRWQDHYATERDYALQIYSDTYKDWANIRPHTSFEGFTVAEIWAQVDTIYDWIEEDRVEMAEAHACAEAERAERIMSPTELDAHRLAEYRATKVTVNSTPFAAALSRV